MVAWVVTSSFDPRRAAPCRHAPGPDKSLRLNSFADPHPLNSSPSIPYKKAGRGGGATLRRRSGASIVQVAPPPILRTLFQVPYHATPLFATLTRTAGVWGYLPILERGLPSDGSLYFPLWPVRDSQAAPQRIEEPSP